MSMSRAQHARADFIHYLRTGQWPSEPDSPIAPAVEFKFNPYHDPRDGRFTFAPGHASALAQVIDSRLHASGRSGQGSFQPRPYLSALHNEVLALAARNLADPGTVEQWHYRGRAGSDKALFKARWVRGHRNAIKAAAARFDIPPALLGAVAYHEVGNDGVSDDIAHAVRDERGRRLPLTGLPRNLLNPAADRTSFGPLNIQERLLPQILGYSSAEAVPESARRLLIPTVKDPVAAIFLAAKHLSDLRDVNFKNVRGGSLSEGQMLVIAARYNLGQEASQAKIRSSFPRTRAYTDIMPNIKKLLR